MTGGIGLVALCIFAILHPRESPDSPSVALAEDVSSSVDAELLAVIQTAVRAPASLDPAALGLPFSPPVEATPRPQMAMRATYVMRRQSAVWRIASARFTPVRPSAR
jgi:hypothetical protein